MTDKDTVKHNLNQIIENIIKKSNTDKNGIFWQTLKVNDSVDKLAFTINDTIYNGNVGILLLLIEYYKYSKEEKYLEIIEKTANWIIEYTKQNPTDLNAFLTGRTGISYVLFQVYKITKNKKYLDETFKIIEESQKTFESTNYICEYINGLAGTVVTLLKIYDETKEESILKNIDECVNKILAGAEFGEKGIWWDRSGTNIKGLCGFSHGVSGIALVFLELGHYFKNDSFYWIAEEAFKYENQFYDAKAENWADFRKGIWDVNSRKENIDAFKNNDKEFFTQPKYMSAWCHGAPGIGLARARAYEILNKPEYLEDLEKAVKKTENILSDHKEDPSKYGNFSLCHGAGGNAEIFIEAFRVTKDAKYLESANKVAEQINQVLEAKIPLKCGYGLPSNGEEDTSLFMGNAGVAYFLLRLSDPENVPLILASRIDTHLDESTDIRDYQTLSICLTQLKRKLLENDFSRTLKILDHIEPDQIDKILNLNGELPENFIKKIQTYIPKSTSREIEVLSEVFELEKTKFELKKSIQSYSYLAVKELLESDKNLETLKNSDDKIMEMKLKINDQIKLFKNKWSWKLDMVSNLEKDPGEYYVLIKLTANKTHEIEITGFTYFIITTIREGKGIEEIIKLIAESKNIEEIEVCVKVIEQVRELIKFNVLN